MFHVHALERAGTYRLNQAFRMLCQYRPPAAFNTFLTFQNTCCPLTATKSFVTSILPETMATLSPHSRKSFGEHSGITEDGSTMATNYMPQVSQLLNNPAGPENLPADEMGLGLITNP